MERIINRWIASLIIGQPDTKLISNNFIFEDGFTKEEYIKQELEQYSTLSPIFNLCKDFSIKVLDKVKYDNFTIIFYHLFNDRQQIVSKMNITIDNNTGLITGNNSNFECVPKFEIREHQVVKVGLAIRGKKVNSIRHIFCESHDLELESLSLGENFDNDSFYSVKFIPAQSIYNSLLQFIISYYNDGKSFIERKNVFFDYFDPNIKPYVINENIFYIDDAKYPVHLYYKDEKGTSYNYEYPRNMTLDISQMKSFIVTDSLDNDWVNI